jgi:hypothetical protein
VKCSVLSARCLPPPRRLPGRRSSRCPAAQLPRSARRRGAGAVLAGAGHPPARYSAVRGRLLAVPGQLLRGYRGAAGVRPRRRAAGDHGRHRAGGSHDVLACGGEARGGHGGRAREAAAAEPHYLRPAATPAQVSDAVYMVSDGRLARRPGGWQEQVSSSELSAGERQLIRLVRAHLSPAPVAVLDEATCQLDPRTERRAEEGFADRGDTLIVIAHQRSSALRTRRVLVLDGVAPRSATTTSCWLPRRSTRSTWATGRPCQHWRRLIKAIPTPERSGSPRSWCAPRSW